jgi:hypothetical protein
VTSIHIKIIVVLVISTFALMAVVGVFAGLLLMILSFAWCKADVEAHGFVMPVGSSILCGLIPPVGVVSHLYRTRSSVDATLALLRVIGVLILGVLAFVLAVASMGVPHAA